MFENEFKGKVVLVTGGSRGIGFAAVKGFLAAGAKVYFLSHYEETGAKALAALKEINPDYEVMTKAVRRSRGSARLPPPCTRWFPV